jgi:ABC-2 type transport system permease protein
MKRYLQLFFLFIKNSLLVELEYRSNFIAHSILGVLWAGVTFASVALFFSHTNDLGGWTFEQALVIAGLFIVLDGIIVMFMEPNLQRIVQMVREGTLDFVLTKPVNSQFISSLRHFKFNGMADVLAGSATLLYAITRLNYSPSLAAIAQFVLMLFVALVLIYSIWLAMSALSFWFVKIDHMQELFRAVFDAARFPVNAFDGAMRFILTFVLPIAFMTTFPAQAVLGRLDTHTMWTALFVALISFVLSALFWRRTVRNYSSASS